MSPQLPPVYFVSCPKLNTVGEYSDQSEDNATGSLFSNMSHYILRSYTLGLPSRLYFNENMPFIICGLKGRGSCNLLRSSQLT